MILGNKILTDEITSLRKENARLQLAFIELVDRFVHNRAPERLARPETKTQTESVPDGMGDPVSVAERRAWEESRPKVPDYLSGHSEPLEAPINA
jgi:hypothetical protein